MSFRTPRRELLRAALATTVATAALLPIALPATAATTPEAPTANDTAQTTTPDVQTAAPVRGAGQDTIKLTPTDNPQDPTLAVATGEMETIDFLTAGVTWSTETDVDVEEVSLRVRQDGRWTGWEDLQVLTGEEADSPRTGTEPLITTGSDAIQVQVRTATGDAPDGIELSLIDPGEATTDGRLEPAAAGAETVTRHAPVALEPEAVTKAASVDRLKPKIITRAQWGANENLASNSASQAKLQAIFLHHTAGTNSYTQATAYAQVRSVFNYHAGSLKWGDIGYHFLVDKFGNIYEGRRGAMTKLVLGTQAGGFNTNTIGVTALGNYETAAPSAAMVNSIEAVMAWQADRWGLNPTGSTTLTSRASAGSTAKYAYGAKASKPTILGHRDTNYTACPGQYLYAKLGAIRTDVKKRIGSGTIIPASPTPAKPVMPGMPAKVSNAYTVHAPGLTATARWGAVSGADHYQIMYRAVPHGGGDVTAQSWKAGRTTTGTSITLSVDPGETAQFAVRAVRDGVNGHLRSLGQSTGPVSWSDDQVHTANMTLVTDSRGAEGKGILAGKAGAALRIEGADAADRLTLTGFASRSPATFDVTRDGKNVGFIRFNGEHTTCALDLPAGSNVRLELRESVPVRITSASLTRPGQTRDLSTSAKLCTTSFTDVKATDTYFNAVNWMLSEGITSGYSSDHTFRPSRKITRGESVAFIYRYMDPKFTASGARAFKDVTKGDTFYTPISWAKATKVTGGYQDGSFGVGRNVTRAEFASFLYRAVAPSYRAPKSKAFKDVSTTSSHHKAISWLKAKGLASGYTDGTYRPSRTITRGEVAAILYRLAH